MWTVFVFLFFKNRHKIAFIGLNTFYQLFLLPVGQSQYAIEVQLWFSSMDRIKFISKNENTTAEFLSFGHKNKRGVGNTFYFSVNLICTLHLCCFADYGRYMAFSPRLIHSPSVIHTPSQSVFMPQLLFLLLPRG